MLFEAVEKPRYIQQKQLEKSKKGEITPKKVQFPVEKLNESLSLNSEVDDSDLFGAFMRRD